MKAYKLGILVGRFQVLHKGHQAMIDKALELCDEVAVFIGSAQESGTQKNPLSFSQRREVIEQIYGQKLKIFPLNDIGVGNNSKWGDYVISSVEKTLGTLPDLLISGKESRRVSWFDGEKASNIAELSIPKTINISSSQMRQFLLQNDFESWAEFCDEKLHDSFEQLRVAVINSMGNTKTASI